MNNTLINEFLVEALTKQYGEELKEEVIEGYNCFRFTTVRINTLKTNKEEVIEEFNKLAILYEENHLFVV